MWRYKELLPIEDTSKIVTLNEGETALWKSTGLAKVLGLRNLYLKDETKNPTWSFKDRGTSVGVSKAREIGYQIVGCVSSGNMAASISTYAAHAGLRALVLLRTGVPIEKIVHMLICGAEVIAVDMPYPRIYRLGLELSKECGICWVHADAPMRIEGQKTSSFEICEQLGWEVPGKVVVPTSSGGNMSAHWKGWRDMYATKLIEEKPSMVAVQIAAAHPIYDAFRQGKDIVQPVVEGDTIATSICNPDPPSGLRVLRLLRESKGLVEVVDDDEILQAQKLLGRTEGIFAEPGGSSSIAGLKKLVDHGSIDRDETVVAVITGAGIKDTKSAIKVAGKPYTVSFESELRDLIATLFRKSEELH
jgi:threonine synthase